MPTSVGPNTFGEENLVFGYDLGDGINSYKGQPTTNNFGGSFRDFTGTGYSQLGEWISSEPTRFTKTYFANLPTPIGPGGTLIEESGVAGFHHLSRYGGGEEDGLHSLSCFIYPFASGITDFCIGMLADGGNNIQFNLDTKAITYGGGISNRNAFISDVPGWPGWLRVGANIEGRAGGWVGCFGYSSYTSYTGTAGGKKAYITGIQYEYKTQPTPFVGGTRSVTQGLIDLTGTSTIDLTNVSFDSSAQMEFDGTNDTASTTTNITLGSNFSMEAVVYRDTSTNGEILSSWSNPYRFLWRITSGNVQLLAWNNGGGSNTVTGTGTVTTGVYRYVTITYDGVNVKFYTNGVLTDTFAKSFSLSNLTAMQVGSNTYDSVYFDGKIPFSKIYNRALTDSEIRSNFNAVKSRFGI